MRQLNILRFLGLSKNDGAERRQPGGILSKLHNIKLTLDGRLKRREGTKLWADNPGLTAKVQGLYSWMDSSGNRSLFVVSGGKIFREYVDSGGNRQWETLNPSSKFQVVDQTGRVQITSYLDNVFFNDYGRNILLYNGFSNSDKAAYLLVDKLIYFAKDKIYFFDYNTMEPDFFEAWTWSITSHTADATATYAGDIRDMVEAGDTVTITSDNNANASVGSYVIKTVTYGAPNTTITFDGALPGTATTAVVHSIRRIKIKNDGSQYWRNKVVYDSFSALSYPNIATLKLGYGIRYGDDINGYYYYVLDNQLNQDSSETGYLLKLDDSFSLVGFLSFQISPGCVIRNFCVHNGEIAFLSSDDTVVYVNTEVLSSRIVTIPNKGGYPTSSSGVKELTLESDGYSIWTYDLDSPPSSAKYVIASGINSAAVVFNDQSNYKNVSPFPNTYSGDTSRKIVSASVSRKNFPETFLGSDGTGYSSISVNRQTLNNVVAERYTAPAPIRTMSQSEWIFYNQASVRPLPAGDFLNSLGGFTLGYQTVSQAGSPISIEQYPDGCYSDYIFGRIIACRCGDSLNNVFIAGNQAMKATYIPAVKNSFGQILRPRIDLSGNYLLDPFVYESVSGSEFVSRECVMRDTVYYGNFQSWADAIYSTTIPPIGSQATSSVVGVLHSSHTSTTSRGTYSYKIYGLANNRLVGILSHGRITGLIGGRHCSSPLVWYSSGYVGYLCNKSAPVQHRYYANQDNDPTPNGTFRTERLLFRGGITTNDGNFGEESVKFVYGQRGVTISGGTAMPSTFVLLSDGWFLLTRAEVTDGLSVFPAHVTGTVSTSGETVYLASPFNSSQNVGPAIFESGDEYLFVHKNDVTGKDNVGKIIFSGPIASASATVSHGLISSPLDSDIRIFFVGRYDGKYIVLANDESSGETAIVTYNSSWAELSYGIIKTSSIEGYSVLPFSAAMDGVSGDILIYRQVTSISDASDTYCDFIKMNAYSETDVIWVSRLFGELMTRDLSVGFNLKDEEVSSLQPVQFDGKNVYFGASAVVSGSDKGVIYSLNVNEFSSKDVERIEAGRLSVSSTPSQDRSFVQIIRGALDALRFTVGGSFSSDGDKTKLALKWDAVDGVSSPLFTTGDFVDYSSGFFYGKEVFTVSEHNDKDKLKYLGTPRLPAVRMETKLSTQTSTWEKGEQVRYFLAFRFFDGTTSPLSEASITLKIPDLGADDQPVRIVLTDINLLTAQGVAIYTTDDVEKILIYREQLQEDGTIWSPPYLVAAMEQGSPSVKGDGTDWYYYGAGTTAVYAEGRFEDLTGVDDLPQSPFVLGQSNQNRFEFMVLHKNRMVFVNNRKDNLNNAIYYSDVDMAEAIGAGDFRIIESGDGDQLVSGISVGDYLYLFKSRKIYAILGDAPDGQLVGIPWPVGCRYKWTVCQAQNTVYFLNDRGVFAMAGQQVIDVGQDRLIDLFDNRRDDCLDIDGMLDSAFAVVDQNEREIRWNCKRKVDGISPAENNFVLIYNYQSNAFRTEEYAFSVVEEKEIEDVVTGERKWVLADNSGLVHERAYRQNDSGRTISYCVRTSEMVPGSPSAGKIFRTIRIFGRYLTAIRVTYVINGVRREGTVLVRNSESGVQSGFMTVWSAGPAAGIMVEISGQDGNDVPFEIEEVVVGYDNLVSL